MTFFLVFLGGGLGSVCRYFISFYLNAKSFPWATLIVNAIGALIMGICIFFVIQKMMSLDKKALIMVGFLGGFTTFSSFGSEVFFMLRNSEFLKASFYVIISNFSVILFCFLGFFITKLIFFR